MWYSLHAFSHYLLANYTKLSSICYLYLSQPYVTPTGLQSGQTLSVQRPSVDPRLAPEHWPYPQLRPCDRPGQLSTPPPPSVERSGYGSAGPRPADRVPSPGVFQHQPVVEWLEVAEQRFGRDVTGAGDHLQGVLPGATLPQRQHRPENTADIH